MCWRGVYPSEHPLWNWLVQCGASPTELHWFLDHPCPPDVVGLNYYLTSDRYLDERLAPYPASSHGANGRERYADVEAVRVSGYEGPAHHRILEEAWQRYGDARRADRGACRVHERRPAALVRQRVARRLGSRDSRGVDVRAVTMWSLLGSFDWNSLVTRDDNVYEVGAFDVRSAPPRRTALATLAQGLAAGTPTDPLARQPGWWQRARRATDPDRYASRILQRTRRPARFSSPGAPARSVPRSTRACEVRGLRAVAVGRAAARYHEPGRDPASAGPVAPVGRHQRRWVRARRRCGGDTAKPAGASTPTVRSSWQPAAAAFQARYVTLSTDLVFDGLKTRPYVESDETNPHERVRRQQTRR